MVKFATLAGLLALCASVVQGQNINITFPASLGVNSTTSFSGFFDFLGQSGSVNVTGSLTTLLLRKRQVASYGYGIYLGSASTGCTAVGALFYSLSAAHGNIAIPPGTVSYLDTTISVIPGTQYFIGGKVLAFTSGGVIIACANIPLTGSSTSTSVVTGASTIASTGSSTSTSTGITTIVVSTTVNVFLSVNVNVNIYNNCGCGTAAIVLVPFIGYIAFAQVITLFGIVYVIVAPGYYVFTQIVTIIPGATVVVTSAKSITITTATITVGTTTTLTALTSTTVITVVPTLPTSTVTITAATTAVVVTSGVVGPTGAVVTTGAAATATVSRFAGAGSKASFAGIAAAAAGVLALL